jgi:uncharacterized membrane protein
LQHQQQKSANAWSKPLHEQVEQQAPRPQVKLHPQQQQQQQQQRQQQQQPAAARSQQQPPPSRKQPITKPAARSFATRHLLALLLFAFHLIARVLGFMLVAHYVVSVSMLPILSVGFCSTA